MILFKNRLILGLVWKTIKVFFTVIYSVLNFFNLHYTLLLGLIGMVLYFTGTLDKNRAVLIVYALLLVVSLVYAVIASVKKLLGLDKKVKRSKGVQIVGKVDTPQPNVAVEPTVQNTNSPYTEQYQPQPAPSEVPRYFRVRQNPSYVMAEYSNKFELYKVQNGQLVKVRTDYKR